MTIYEDSYQLGKLAGYEDGARYWKKEGAASERAQIVAWLRRYANEIKLSPPGDGAWLLNRAADEIENGLAIPIERGEHAAPQREPGDG